MEDSTGRKNPIYLQDNKGEAPPETKNKDWRRKRANTPSPQEDRRGNKYTKPTRGIAPKQPHTAETTLLRAGAIRKPQSKHEASFATEPNARREHSGSSGVEHRGQT